MSNLESNLREDFINIHLPYRLEILMSHDILEKTLPDNHTNRDLILKASFEDSIVFGRLLLNFLGIGIKRNNDREINRKMKTEVDDFNIENLGLTFVNLDNKLIKENYQAICILLKYANKTVAHCTSNFPSNGEQEQFKIAKKAIYELVINHITEIDRSKLMWEKYK